MTESNRAAILSTIRAQLGGESPGRLTTAQLDARLAKPPQHTVPQRGQLEHAERLELFTAMAEAAAASIERVAGMDEVPAAVAAFLLRHNWPSDVVVAGELAELPWSMQARLKIDVRAARDGDKVSVTSAVAGVAETGTVLLSSDPARPSTLNFLPDCHLVVVSADTVVGAYEEAFGLLRAQPLPRTLNFVTGPSRSADIEQTLQLGAHGPVHLHILLVESEE